MPETVRVFFRRKHTRDEWRISSSNCGDAVMSIEPVSSSSRYLRAMAMAFIAWLMAAGPVATTAGGWPLEDSRTTWQMAPAIEFGFESPLTFSRGLSEAATSPTLACARWSSPETALERA